MASLESDPERLAPAGSWRKVALGVLVLNALWLGRGVIDPGFGNLDVTGIVYNARLLLLGKLPYLDSAEVKPPGAFVLIAPALWALGLRGVWLLGIAWGTLTSLATGALAKACYGDKWGRRVALLHAAASVVASSPSLSPCSRSSSVRRFCLRTRSIAMLWASARR